MKIIQDYYIILMDGKYESGSNVVQLNTAYMEEWAEEHLKYRKQHGRVMTVPPSFSNEVLDIVNQGSPEYKLYTSGDYIGSMIEQGYTRTPAYYPSTYEKFPEITIADVAKTVDVRVGETVYFDYMATDQKYFLGKHNGLDMYMVRVDSIFCSIRDGVIIPQGGWCFVNPVMETWDEITTPSGIVKKPKPEAKYLQGYVRYCSTREDVSPGDHILYQRHADYKMIIEGNEYYVMKEEDLLCKV